MTGSWNTHPRRRSSDISPWFLPLFSIMQSHSSDDSLQKDDAGEAKNVEYFHKKIESRHNTFRQIRGKRLRILDVPCENRDAPVLFLLHGLAGQGEQFYSQLSFYHKRLPMVAVDLPGQGQSPAPYGDEHYTADALVEDIIEVMLQTCQGKQIVFVAHSYGTSLLAFLLQTLKKSSHKEAAGKIEIVGCVLVGATVDTNGVLTPPSFASWLPSILLDALRVWERYGGTNSMLVKRFVHEMARPTVKSLMLEWGKTTPSRVALALFRGMRLASLDDYRQIDLPTALVIGSHDVITPKESTFQIYDVLKRPHGPYVVDDSGHMVMAEKNELVNALITAFLQKKCGIREFKLELPHGSLKNHSHKPKWALKNYFKWKTTQSFGEVIRMAGDKSAHGGICGCKVLRQDDLEHAPDTFQQKRPNVGLVIDISRETPPYLSTSFTSCDYVKLPTPSRVIPTEEHAKEFIAIVKRFWSEPENVTKDIAVHCHYGFNRTGFLICCYLIEEFGYTPHDAVEAFKCSRQPGIKHNEFIEHLHTRYPSH